MCSWDGTSIGPEHERSDAVREEMTQRPALCCVCGTTRSTSARGAGLDVEADDRCVVTRTCATCQARTPHAYLLLEGHADRNERERPYPMLDEATEAELFELEVGEARAEGIKVSDRPVANPILVSVMQYLDDGVWEVCLDPDASSRRRRLGLHTALAAIRNARARRWFVVVPDRGNLQRAVRFEVFGGALEDESVRPGSTLTRGTAVDPDGLEPPTSAR
jgi:hypothetical protein